MARRRNKDQLVLQAAEPEPPPDWGERWARREGYRCVAGVDEVGRGPLAGPVVAAAVVLPSDLEPELVEAGLDDSKRVTVELREALSARIRARSAVGIGVVDAARIDRINIRRATMEAMHVALSTLVQTAQAEPDCILVDGREPIVPSPLPRVPQRALVQGDSRALCVAAASIVAKVHRDTRMLELDGRYPGYGFAAHKGYGCREHSDALARLGPSPVHRRSFRGVGGKPGDGSSAERPPQLPFG